MVNSVVGILKRHLNIGKTILYFFSFFFCGEQVFSIIRRGSECWLVLCHIHTEQQPFSVFLKPEPQGEFTQSDEADEKSAEKGGEE